MPSTSRDALELVDHGPVAERTVQIEDLTLSYATMKERVDMAPILAGLPGGVCDCPHWGVLEKGEFSVRYADGAEETVHAGQSFYLTRGHVPIFEAGCEVLMFSPTEELKATDAAIAASFGEAEGIVDRTSR